MSKKKRKVKKPVVYIAAEGYREQCLVNYAQDLLDPEKTVNIRFSPEKGGTSNAILDRALKALHCYDKVYAWFDEDDKLDSEHRQELEKRWGVELLADLEDCKLQKENISSKKPVIIVSSPLSVEGIIIRLFDKNLPNLREPVRSPENFEDNKAMMKSAVKGIFGKYTDREFYERNLTRERLLDKAKIMPEIALLVSIFDKN